MPALGAAGATRVAKTSGREEAPLFAADNMSVADVSRGTSGVLPLVRNHPPSARILRASFVVVVSDDGVQ